MTAARLTLLLCLYCFGIWVVRCRMQDILEGYDPPGTAADTNVADTNVSSV